MNLRLIKISARNFKGQSFDRDLPEAITLVGSNWAGKSSRTDAIRLLLLGYLPELGKTNRATFSLSSGRSMSVSGVLSDGRHLSRSWTLKGDAIKAEADGFDDFGADAGEAEALATMLDATTYFERNAADRIAYVFGLIPPADLPSPESLLAAIREGIEKAVESFKPAEVEALIEIGRAEARKFRRAPQAFLESYQAAVADLAKLKRAETGRFEKTIQGLTQLRSAESVGRTAAEIEAEAAQVLGAAREVARQLADRRAAANAVAASGARRKHLQYQIDDARQARADMLAAEEALRAAELARATGEEVVPDPDATGRKLTEIRIDYARSSERFQAISATVKELNKTNAGIDSLTSCPFCGAAGDGWKELKRAEIAGRMEDLRAQLKAEEDALPALAREAEELEALLTRGREVAARNASLRAACDRAKEKVRTLREASARLEALQDELAALPPHASQESAEEVERLRAKENELAARDRALREELMNVRARALEVNRLADAEKAREEASRAEDLADAAVSVIRAEKEKLVEKAFAPLLRSANAFLGEILSTPIAYRDGEIGTVRAGVWVGHRTLSGTEKALVYASIQVALAQASPLRIVLLDELGRLDDENARKVDAAVNSAVASGRISQYVGIDAGRADLHGKFMAVEEVLP